MCLRHPVVVSGRALLCVAVCMLQYVCCIVRVAVCVVQCECWSVRVAVRVAVEELQRVCIATHS